MAEGKNREYVANPAAFLQANIITRNLASAPIASPGPANIDLVPSGVPNAVFIENYDLRSHGIGASPIRAYWLPAIVNGTNTIQLGNNANYLFTDEMTGCLFASYYNAAGNQIVEHTNDYASAGTVAPRLNAIFPLAAANRPIKVLTRVPVPGGLAIPPAPSSVVHYPQTVWVIGGRTGAGWVFRYRLSGALLTQLL